MNVPAILFALSAGLLVAQNPASVSPEVHADRTVTFRVRAPNAKAVTVGGDFDQRREAMLKDDTGLWSATLGPLPPDLYSYTFSIDGVAFADPVNPLLKTGVRNYQSIVIVPGDPPMAWEERPVPHGRVDTHYYASQAAADHREYCVYLPPGYDRDTKIRYPVLYLLHGSGDTARSWVEIGRANFILDNLLAAGKSKPMLIVMPFGHTPGGSASEAFGKHLLEEIVPMVERQYRVYADRGHRAIAGLSMGGGQSIRVGFAHPELFSSIGIFSAAARLEDFSERYPSLFADPEATNRKMRLIWIGIGKEDNAFKMAQALSEYLEQKKLRNTFHASEGGHTWRNWRVYLNEVLPKLF